MRVFLKYHGQGDKGKREKKEEEEEEGASEGPSMMGGSKADHTNLKKLRSSMTFCTPTKLSVAPSSPKSGWLLR